MRKEVANTVPVDRNIEGIIEIMLDATQDYKALGQNVNSAQAFLIYSI